MRPVFNLSLFPLQPADRKPEKRRQSTPRPARALEPPQPAPLARARPRQLWLAIHLPRLALEALQEPSPQPSPASGRGSGPSPQPSPRKRGEGEDASPLPRRRGRGQGEGVGPLAVIDPDSRQQIVLACNEAARTAGVRPGQSLNAAIALAADLETLPRDARKERERLAHLAAWCQQRFTPLVSVEPADELLLEVKGSLRLFGGARALVERIATGLNEQGVTAHLALTPTPRSALWLARRGSGVLIGRPEALAQRLAPVALGHLRWPEELLEQLYGMGLRTVGDLLRLPRGGVVRRLGQAWLDEFDRALGRRPDVRHGFRGPEHFSERRVLEHEIETAAGLEFACQPLMARLQAFLRQRQAAIAVLAVDLKHRTHPVTRLRIGLAAPSGDVEHLRGLLAERLAALALPAPVIAIRMRSGALLEQVLATDSFRNFTPSPRPGERVGVRGSCDADALPRLIERLRARLGNDAVFGMSEVEDHRPERAWRVIEMPSLLPSPQPSPTSGRGSGSGRGRRPLWLLAEPLALTPTFSRVLAGEGLRTMLSRKRERERKLELLRGPERIETGWWDGREVTRDYFVARDAHGVRLWIYRDRRAPKNWYVHGLFG